MAYEQARETFRNAPATLQVLEDRIGAQIELRSLTCTQSFSISRLETVENISALPIRQECLAEQDEILAAIIGTFRLGNLLKQPPLRPLASLDGAPGIPKIGGVSPSKFVAASAANVLLVEGSHFDQFMSVEVPSGRTIATLPRIQWAGHRKFVSPNGRLVAMNIGANGVTFLDMESGDKLWDTRKIARFYAWLPDISAALVHSAESGALALLDLETGRLEDYSIGLKEITWVTPASQNGGVWLGTQRDFIRVEHTRAPDGIRPVVTKEFRLSKRAGVTSDAPTLMNHGKSLFFISGRDFGSLNLENGLDTAWNVADFLANRYAKLSETTLLVESTKLSGVGTDAWVLDIEKRTLAPVDASTYAGGTRGLLVGMEGRTGWIRRGSSTHFGSTVTTGTPKPLDELQRAFNLERQIAKLEMMEQREKVAAERARLLSEAGALVRSGNSGSASSSSTDSAAPKAGLPSSAKVEAVGVYQGARTSGPTSTDGRKMGTVDVHVRQGSKPLILVLSSYEPVHWRISRVPGARLDGVLLSGYHQSQVTGAGSARVLNIGRSYAYKRGSSKYTALDREVRSWTGGQGIQVFQGRYDGGVYMVGG
ncbi:hypothetical protein [Nitrogeniibacter aestuarii]|uniref:hypothetical protein n=1 Tax=Nitrogeniibacter aestuarii TaxID=2815343 RepID=UPI001D112EC2|nr:hypothetical protein [Nitrogeniibacter aestuarii]